MSQSTEESYNGFTLIELLIVVAIIGILAAIAVPNFLEAQIRAKVSRAKADLRAFATGFESYYIDWNTFPPCQWDGTTMRFISFNRLTTPVAYCSTIPNDPFGVSEENPGQYMQCYEYGAGLAGKRSSSWDYYPNNTYILESNGPGRKDISLNALGGVATSQYPVDGWIRNTPEFLTGLIYSPTNGTFSRGEIIRVGGVPPPQPNLRRFFDLVASQ